VSELFIEIGTEELPARFVGPALEGLAAVADKLLAGIPHGAIRTFGTPRRIAVAVADVAPAKPAVEKLVTGPPVAADPAPFAKARGVAVESLEQVDGPKGRVWAFRQAQGGESTASVVAAGLADAVLALPFKKSMRWGSGPARFGRPIRHVCAVLDGERIPASVAGVETVATSDGHWLLAPERFAVRSADAYVADLRERHVIVDVVERRASIVAGLEAAAAEAGLPGQDFDTDLLDEVTHLVEAPAVIEGRFAEELLVLPPRLLVESMKVNQRYFPLYRPATHGRALTNRFLVVTNNPHGDAALIADGNARVLAARFHDAKFFYAEDRRKPLAQHGEKLTGTVWIRGLGTMAERQGAVAEAASGVAALIGADPGVARAAGALCKSDLATQMVGEFPELQGHVGRLLAEAEGLPADVASAIEEAYLPRFSGDATPHSPAGRALALAERLTLLARAFAAGLQPKGSSDHQGLRRAANGVVAIVLASGWRGELSALFRAADADPTAELLEFVTARLRATLLDEELPTDLVDAVLAADATDLVWAVARARALASLARSGAFAPIRATFRRVAGLAKDHASTDYDAAGFEHDTERALHAALAGLPSAGSDLDAELAALSAFRPVVDAFFDAVLVMAPDPTVRANRLGLLRAIVARFGRLADFSRLSTD
jgi:glycyl-tRNA synthetase beta chain